jgi:hypothetical protein
VPAQGNTGGSEVLLEVVVGGGIDLLMVELDLQDERSIR